MGSGCAKLYNNNKLNVDDTISNIISSNETTKLVDNKGNIHFVDNFIFEIKKDLTPLSTTVLKQPPMTTRSASFGAL